MRDELNLPDTLSEEQAEALRARLEKHYGEPLRRMSEYCGAFRTWFRAMQRNNTDPILLQSSHGWTHGEEYHHLLDRIEIDITKSNLLARLLYAREPLRPHLCPVHQGHWNGSAMLTGDCPHHCGGTGWLHEPPENSP